jgi:hypothetical protein
MAFAVLLNEYRMLASKATIGRKSVREAALSKGPTHNPPSRDLYLYNTASGKQLKEWSGNLDARPPTWGAKLKQ